MIVVDTNIIAAYLLPAGEHSAAAASLVQRDRVWVAPLLWRSEFGNVLCTSLRQGRIDLKSAHELRVLADDLMLGGEYSVPSEAVMDLASKSECTFYDCEFVALARLLEVPLVTLDRALLRAFPETAMALEVGS
jgi:predicted nucleic acid-binding protein